MEKMQSSKSKRQREKERKETDAELWQMLQLQTCSNTLTTAMIKLQSYTLQQPVSFLCKSPPAMMGKSQSVYLMKAVGPTKAWQGVTGNAVSPVHNHLASLPGLQGQAGWRAGAQAAHHSGDQDICTSSLRYAQENQYLLRGIPGHVLVPPFTLSGN